MLGVLQAALVLGERLAHAGVNYAATLPGSRGAAVAFGAELAISFVLMTVVLVVSSRPRLARFTGLFAAALVATYITLEAPLSGMSMNPARSFGSAFFAREWSALWIYFVAPPLGMLLAAETYVRVRGARAVACAKLHHDNPSRCIFCAFRRQRGWLSIAASWAAWSRPSCWSSPRACRPGPASRPASRSCAPSRRWA